MPMFDTSPAEGGVAVTPSDSENIALTRGFDVGVGGDVKVTFQNGNTVVLPNRPSGTYYPYKVTRIWATDTTATNITALY